MQRPSLPDGALGYAFNKNLSPGSRVTWRDEVSGEPGLDSIGRSESTAFPGSKRSAGDIIEGLRPEQFSDPSRPGVTPKTYENISPRENQQAELAEEKVRRFIHRFRPNLPGRFRQHDPHHCGKINESKFRETFSWAQVPLSQAEITVLVDKYLLTENFRPLVNWREFMDCVEPLLEPGLDKRPNQGPADRKTPLEMKIRHMPQTVDLSLADEREVAKLMQFVRRQCKIHGVNLKPLMQDFDKVDIPGANTQVGFVTKPQFASVFFSVKLQLTAPQIDVLARKYATLDDKTVNYFAFCEDVSPEEDTVHPYGLKPLHAMEHDPSFGHVMPRTKKQIDTFTAPKTHLSRGPFLTDRDPVVRSPGDSRLKVNDVMARIRGIAYRHRLKVEEFMRDYDRLNCGVITKAQFLAGLHLAFERLHLNLSPDETDQVVAAFQHGTRDGMPLVQWVVFCDDINTAFTRLNQERNPNADYTTGQASMTRAMPTLNAHAATQGCYLEGRETVYSDSDKSAYVMKALRQVAAETDAHRILLKPYFEELSKSKGSPMMIGRVTRPQFFQVLTKLNFAISAEEKTALAQHFDFAGDGSVDYVKFCKACAGDLSNPRAVHGCTLQYIDTMPADVAGAPLVPCRVKAKKNFLNDEKLTMKLQQRAVPGSHYNASYNAGSSFK